MTKTFVKTGIQQQQWQHFKSAVVTVKCCKTKLKTGVTIWAEVSPVGAVRPVQLHTAQWQVCTVHWHCCVLLRVDSNKQQLQTNPSWGVCSVVTAVDQ